MTAGGATALLNGSSNGPSLRPDVLAQPANESKHKTRKNGATERTRLSQVVLRALVVEILLFITIQYIDNGA
jgi:hypothetical protein